MSTPVRRQGTGRVWFSGSVCDKEPSKDPGESAEHTSSLYERLGTGSRHVGGESQELDPNRQKQG
jgi:hypothetical protein